jgi:hypothetical protein
VKVGKAIIRSAAAAVSCSMCSDAYTREPCCRVGSDRTTSGTSPRAWGPLAVIHEQGVGGLDAGTGPGRLLIGDRCVTLSGDEGSEMTLVWRDGQTQWNLDDRTIEFVGQTKGPMTLS